jgi:hypothetical protein
MIKNHGAEHFLQTEEGKEKFKQISQERFGTDHPFQAEEVKQKIRETCQERFGVDCVLQSEKVKEEIKKTRLKQDTEKAINLFLEMGIGIISEYKHNRHPTIFKCKSCNFEFEDIPFNLYVREHKCPACDPLRIEETSEKIKQTKRKINSENAKKQFLEMGFEIIGEYRTNIDKIEFKCLNCGFVFKEGPANLKKRIHKCPVCNPFITSVLESKIAEEIQARIITKTGKIVYIKRNDRTAIAPYEIDILIPELGLSVEVNGDYWHSLPGKPEIDELKTNLIIDQKFKHLVIKESEWKNNKSDVLNKFDQLLEMDFENYSENIFYFTGFSKKEDSDAE